MGEDTRNMQLARYRQIREGGVPPAVGPPGAIPPVNKTAKPVHVLETFSKPALRHRITCSMNSEDSGYHHVKSWLCI